MPLDHTSNCLGTLIGLYMKCNRMQPRCNYYLRSYCERWLTHWGCHFTVKFEIYIYILIRFHWSLHLRVQLTSYSACSVQVMVWCHQNYVIHKENHCKTIICCANTILCNIIFSWQKETWCSWNATLPNLIEELPYVGWNDQQVIAWFLHTSQFLPCHGVSSCDGQQMDILDCTVVTPVASSGKISLLVAVWLQSGWMRLQWHEVNAESNWYTPVVKMKHLNWMNKGLLVLLTDVVS